MKKYNILDSYLFEIQNNFNSIVIKIEDFNKLDKNILDKFQAFWIELEKYHNNLAKLSGLISPPSNKSFKDYFERTVKTTKMAKLIYCEIDNEIVGIVSIQKDKGSSNTFWVTDFFVDPKYRNKGVGKKLLNKALDKSKKEKYVFLMVMGKNDSALNLYKKFGFQINFTSYQMVKIQ